MTCKDHDARSGQAMLIAVLSLGAAILGATTVAGILTLYQIRATTDTMNSSKALFAADTGVEWTLMSYYCNVTGRTPCPPSSPNLSASGAAVTSTCYDINDNPVSCSDTTSTVYAIAIGSSAGTKRAFEVSLVGATSTDP